jgi:hypothetical protein
VAASQRERETERERERERERQRKRERERREREREREGQGDRAHSNSHKLLPTLAAPPLNLPQRLRETLLMHKSKESTSNFFHQHAPTITS